MAGQSSILSAQNVRPQLLGQFICAGEAEEMRLSCSHGEGVRKVNNGKLWGEREEREERVGGVKTAAQNEAETLRGGGAMTSSMATFILSFQASKSKYT